MQVRHRGLALQTGDWRRYAATSS